MPKPVSIENIFAAYVNQTTLAEAAGWLASNASGDLAYREEVLEALRDAEKRGSEGDPSVVSAVNLSGYRVSDVVEAVELIRELRELFSAELDHR